MLNNIYNPLNGPLSRMTHVSRHQLKTFIFIPSHPVFVVTIQLLYFTFYVV